jgi:alpha-mannosidase
MDFLLETGSDVLRVELEIDWKESHKLLKFHAATGYQGRFARFAGPFGSVRRSQKPGFSREEAQWESCGQRWAAVTSEAEDEGLAILTEAKYGFSCRDGNLGLSLLRAPTEPDPTADRRAHKIRFAIGAHRATSQGDVLSTAAAAEALYAPFIQCRLARPAEARFELLDTGSLVASAVKPAEDGKGCIVRMHETCGMKGSARLRFKAGQGTAALCDILERPLEGAILGTGPECAIPYGPYDILSVRVHA